LGGGYGRIHAGGVGIDGIVVIDFPVEHLKNICNKAGGIDTPNLRRWLATREPQLFEADSTWPHVPGEWFEHFQRNDMKMPPHTLSATLYAALEHSALSAVILAYFDAFTARASVRAKTQAEEIVRRTLVSAGKREAKGVVAQNYTLQAITAMAKASLDKNRAQCAY
jgi:hypothetical protein